MSNRFAGRVAAVSGTTSGIGRAVADVSSVARASAEALVRGDGRIDHVVANAGIRGSDTAGVTAMARTLAVEWGSRGVRVNTVSPGYVSTPFLQGDTSSHGHWLANTITGRFATVDEIAAGTLYLLSDDAGYCYGTDLLIDGGYSLR